MALVIASQLRKELSGWQLFDGVSFKVERRDRIALSGPNGAGKTTLLRILNGETDYQGGELVFSKGTRVALHDQRPPLEQGLTLREYVLSGAADLVATERELRYLEHKMAGGQHVRSPLRRYSDAQARLERAGGYAWRDRAASVVRGLGFAEPDLDRPLETFSGGELTRASLARALGGDPDLLLLDEPTNHLDVASLEWLQQGLQSPRARGLPVAPDPRVLPAGPPRAAGGPCSRPEASRSARARRTSCTTSVSRSSAASTSPSLARTGPARRRCSRRSFRYGSPSPARSGSATASCPLTSPSTRSNWTRPAASSTARKRRRGSSGPRRRTCLGASSSPAGKSRTRRSSSSQGASADGLPSRWSSPRARTSCCSTSRPTISTSKAARLSSWRSRRSPERSCSSPTTARCSTRLPSGRSRSKTARSVPTTGAGPITSGGVTRS